MKVFHDFHASGKFERSLNATTFITLIPKIPGDVDSKDFCPIVFWVAFTKLFL